MTKPWYGRAGGSVATFWRRVTGRERARLLERLLGEMMDQVTACHAAEAERLAEFKADIQLQQKTTAFYRAQAEALGAQVNALASANQSMEHQLQDAHREIARLEGEKTCA